MASAAACAGWGGVAASYRRVPGWGVRVFRVLALAAHVAMRDRIFGNRDGQAECAGDSWIFMNAAMRDRGLIGGEFL